VVRSSTGSGTLDITAIARRYGRGLAAAANLVLENVRLAQEAAAAGIADAVRGREPPELPESPDPYPALLAAVLAQSLVRYTEAREIDPSPNGARRDLIDALAPLQRAVLVARRAGAVAELSAALGMAPERLRAGLVQAVDQGENEEALSAAASRRTAGISLSVDPQRVETELATQSLGRRRSRGVRAALIAAALVAVAGVAVLLAAPLPPQPAAADGPTTQPASGDAPEAANRHQLMQLPPLVVGEDLGLAECRIEPSSTPVAFRGWLTRGDLAGGSPETADRLVYALVTAGEAEWVGWQTGEPRAMYPRPVGRLGCAVDPADGSVAVYAIGEDWQPPADVDGCPSTDVHIYGAFREIGGPRLFAVLPGDNTSWRAGDPDLEIYLRAPGKVPAAAQLTATARQLGVGRGRDLPVRRQSVSPPGTPARNLYLTVAPATFPRAGCWVIEIALDGEPIGATVLPVAPAR
jgi:hypothetical protein